jgi:outer membrane protein, heavy metal efflux system
MVVANSSRVHIEVWLRRALTHRSCSACGGLLLLILLLGTSGALAETVSAGARFRAQDAHSLERIEQALLQTAPELAEARGTVEVARAEERQSRLWANPALSASWGTLPVGQTNPPDLARPYANVPNYSVELSYGLTAGKRGPRIRGSEARARASREELAARVRALALQLAAVVGEIASITLREHGLHALIEDARSDLEAARARLAATFGTQLEVQRLELEAGRAEQHLLDAQAQRERALRVCAVLVGVPCEPFDDVQGARAFFERWLGRAPEIDRSLAARSDLKALRELERASLEEAELARAGRFPDPQLSLGYMHDRFIVSGNQRNSLNFGVSVPLPLVDRGQARAAAAQSRAAALREEQQLRRSTAQAAIGQLQQELEAVRARQRQLSQTLLPKATEIVGELETAVKGRLTPLSDLIQARRTLDELLLQESDSYADAFHALLALTAQSGSAP